MIKIKWTKLTMMELKSPIKMSKIGKRMNLLNVSLGLGILILNPIREKNQFQFSLGHEGWRGHWLEGKISIGQGKQAQGGVIGGLQKKMVSCVCFLEGGGKWVCGKFLVLMCGKMLFMEEKCVQTKTMKERYV